MNRSLLALLTALALPGCTLSPFADDDDSGATDDDDTGSDDDDTGSDDDDTGSDDDDTGSDDDDTGDDDDSTPPGPVACAPGVTQLSLTSGNPQTVQMSATIDDGSGPQPATNVTWTVIDGPGTVDTNGLFTSPSDVGGLALVQAWQDGEYGICEVEMTMDAVDNQSGNSSVPGAFSGTTPTTNDSCAAELLYPLDDSAMPGSFAPPVFQWDANGNDMHQVEIASTWTTLTVYTSGDSFQPTQSQWLGLTLYDPGDWITVTLTSGDWNGSGFNGTPCTTSAPWNVEVTDGGINGTIVYWEPPFTKSVSFDATAGTSTSSNVAFAPATCHGCHTVNLANPMLMTYGNGFPGSTALVDLANPGTVLQQWGNSFFPMMDYGAPDPTGNYVVVGETAFLGGNTLKLMNAQNGSQLATITTAKNAGMPNWSPDGTKLVYIGCDGIASALEAAECDLYTQDWNPASETFSNETLIATRPSGQTLYYPSFSPDSQWVAYNKATPQSTADGTNWSNANPTAQMMLVNANGGPQIELTEANGVGDLTNSWPRWAPVSGNFGWLAVSTKRAYGHTVEDRSQLWVTAIDFTAAAAGNDPSRPPAWIPGQSTAAGNHTPTWLPRFGP